MARFRAKSGRLIHYAAMTADLPFWKTTKLSQMSRAQWESLCDGCGKCCLNKLIDDDTGELFFTNAACHQLDLRNCRCKDYAHRHKLVPDCVRLTPRNINEIDWLPETCAYRLLRDGQDLPSWHPLVSGDPSTVHKAGISVRGKAINETKAGPLENHIIDWA